MSNKERVLILCTGNSARSQMAEGYLRHITGDRFAVESAGTIASFVRPQAIAVMSELEIDISNHTSKSLDQFRSQSFDHVITVCDNAGQNCPIFPGKANRTHWSFDDPAEATGSETDLHELFRRVRDKIAAKLDEFVSN